jgi:hypothetical protein
MKRTYWLDPRDKPALLIALMRQLAGNAHIAFEGDRKDMDNMNFSAIQSVVENLKTPFKHEWNANGAAVVLPLNNHTIGPILKQILPEGRFVHEIEAIQIEKDGQIEFIAGDNFHRECVSVGPAVPERLLHDLLDSGILRGYYSVKLGTDSITKAIRAKGKI